MKNIVGDNFCEVEKYRLYRNVSEIIRPTISKKNISNYKVVVDEKLLPILVFYPKKVSDINSVIIYVVGDGNVSGCYGKYSDICKKLAKETNKLVVAIDYFGSTVKYPTVVNKVYKIIKYLYDEFNNNGICYENIVLMGDSTGCKILGGIVTKMLNKNILLNRLIMFYPVVRDSYKDYSWNESCMNINFNLEKKLDKFLTKYFLQAGDVSCSLFEMVYLKNFPKTLIVSGDMDLLKDDAYLLAEKMINSNEESRYVNIKFAGHGFLGASDEEILIETYKEINDFLN